MLMCQIKCSNLVISHINLFVEIFLDFLPMYKIWAALDFHRINSYKGEDAEFYNY